MLTEFSPNTEPRKKESKKQRVIIRQKISPMLVDLQPRDIPFPFTSIKDYEAFIQQPLGLDWSTPMAHSSLIQPSIITKVIPVPISIFLLQITQF